MFVAVKSTEQQLHFDMSVACAAVGVPLVGFWAKYKSPLEKTTLKAPKGLVNKVLLTLLSNKKHACFESAQGKTLYDRLRELGLFIMEKRKPWRDLRATYQYLERTCMKAGERFFERTHSDNGLKMKEARFKLDIRKTIFAVKVLRLCNPERLWTCHACKC
ncbi:hypothetical protein HGM15179_017716 [Zosterops borbonicus]|uniref:Uncharacterized protein n=1 Tax=Zosterops borbonicus TaxID=364589 RepID=A0A8K1LD29_9PASS|nr:hypothetical protein HGM15179_017716 [Zosterops borbonicus]